MSDDDEIEGPLWRAGSGRFFGQALNGYLFDPSGACVGYMHGRFAVDPQGQVIGEIYGSHWIGRRTSVGYPQLSSRSCSRSASATTRADRPGGAHAIGWVDPA